MTITKMTSVTLLSALLLICGATVLVQGCGGSSNGNGSGGSGGGGGAGGTQMGGNDGALPGTDAQPSGPTCGQAGMPCCDGNTCNGAGCCVSGVCMAQGGTCVGLGNGVCNAGACGNCGGPGLPCCGANPAAGVCTASGTTCSVGICIKCGELGLPCCAGASSASVCAGTEVICASNVCVACGGPNQACCPVTGNGEPCQSGTICSGSEADAVCARCGALGDICCNGDKCSDGCCVGGRCMATSACASGGIDGGARDVPIGGAGGGGSGGTGGSGGAGGQGGYGGTMTIPAGCGDGIVLAPEQCDDGNTMPFDGCSSDCRFEPKCNGSGPCTSRCGDGLVLGEECDDGNRVGGDGCSSTCTVEPGFTCTQPPLGNTIAVPAVYRDFQFSSYAAKPNDFENGVAGVPTASLGIVQDDLDADGKPVYTGITGGAVHIIGQDSFRTWYRNTDGVNHANVSRMILWNNGNGAYVNRYGADGQQWQNLKPAYFCGNLGEEAKDSSGKAIPCTMMIDGAMLDTDCSKQTALGLKMAKCNLVGRIYSALFVVGSLDGTPLFFPVDGDKFSAASDLYSTQIPPMYDPSASWPEDVDENGKVVLHNFSFTSEFRSWFKYEAGKTYTLNIGGDDDVWVFINKKLAVDLGGIHMPAEESLVLDSAKAAKLGLVAGNVYEIAVFQAERQTNSSTFNLTLPGFNTAPSECRTK